MRISDWSSDVCSSDLSGLGADGHGRAQCHRAGRRLGARAAGGDRWAGAGRQREFSRLAGRNAALVSCRSGGSRELLAPPPATAGGGWEGVLTVRVDPKDTTPQPSPALYGEGATARCFPDTPRWYNPRAILSPRPLSRTLRPNIPIN